MFAHFDLLFFNYSIIQLFSCCLLMVSVVKTDIEGVVLE